MTQTALIERITRSLAYMLRHQPEKFDLELDAHGYGELDDVIRALNERLGEPVDEADVREAISSGDRPRYEIRGDRVRALYGHSIDVAPGEASQPPEHLFVPVSSRDADRALRYGLRSGRRRFLHLYLTPEDARESGRRIGREYSVLRVSAVEAWEEGLDFYDRVSLFLADSIPTRYLELLERMSDGRPPRDRDDGPRRGGRGGRGRRGRRDDEDGFDDEERADGGSHDEERGSRRGGRDRDRDREPEPEPERDREPEREQDRDADSDELRPRRSEERGEGRGRRSRGRRDDRPDRERGGGRGRGSRDRDERGRGRDGRSRGDRSRDDRSRGDRSRDDRSRGGRDERRGARPERDERPAARTGGRKGADDRSQPAFGAGLDDDSRKPSGDERREREPRRAPQKRSAPTPQPTPQPAREPEPAPEPGDSFGAGL